MIRNYVTLIDVVLRVGSAAMAHSGGFSSHYKCVIHQLHSLAVSCITLPLVISSLLLNVDAKVLYASEDTRQSF